MSETPTPTPTPTATASATSAPTPEALAVWLADRRWFAGGDEARPLKITVTSVPLRTEPPVSIAVVDTGSGGPLPAPGRRLRAARRRR